jgi:NAD(P)-dependent dehydrogenase (short-subunit alcohol dehydrogenase family)/acyl carrier protein
LRKHLSAQKNDLAEPVFREMALAAANLALGSMNHMVRNVNVAELLPKQNGSDLIVQATLVQNGSTATFELFSRESETSDWQRHFTAKIQVGIVDSRWFYNLTWQASESIASTADEPLVNSNWLILSDCLGVGEEFASRLKDRGATYKLVPSSDTTVDFESLLDGLEPSSTQILYLWGLELRDNQQIASLEKLANQNSSIESLISLVQAMLRRGWSRIPGLFVVTQGAQTITADGPELMPSLLWGLGRVLSLEQPDILRRMIDLPVGQPAPSLVDTLLLEIQQQDAEDQIAYRNGQRYVPRLVPAVHSGSEVRPLTIAPDGVYLITGGLGMLGLQLGRWLAERGARHLVLTGRTGLPERIQWTSIAPDTLMGRRISAVQALEEMGVQITIARADVSDRMAMKQLFAQFGAALPPLRGVIHAAGTNANQTVADLNFDTWRDVLKPKVDGAWVLHNLTTEIPLDFFVCFSSAASVWGSQGMAAYAAANHFIDQLAHYRRAHRLPALTVNWGWWAGDGIATDEQSSLFAKVGMSTMPTEKALEALAHLIELDVTQEIVANVDWSVFAPIYASRRERPFLSQIQIPAAEKPPSPETETKTEKNSLLGQLQALSSPEKQREMLTDYIRQITAEVMGFDKSRVLNTREGFFKMGMDSLMTVQLRTRLESTLGCSLPPTIAFEYPTISQLAGYILQDVLHLPEKSAAVETTNQSESSQADPELDALSDENLLDLLDDELAKVDNLTK